LSLAIENCEIICEVLQSEGLRPLHHSHVGGVFETEEEIVALLDGLGGEVIGFGPDTGHLR
jgi:inosose dehydratase